MQEDQAKQYLHPQQPKGDEMVDQSNIYDKIKIAQNYQIDQSEHTAVRNESIKKEPQQILATLNNTQPQKEIINNNFGKSLEAIKNQQSLNNKEAQALDHQDENDNIKSKAQNRYMIDEIEDIQDKSNLNHKNSQQLRANVIDLDEIKQNPQIEGESFEQEKMKNSTDLDIPKIDRSHDCGQSSYHIQEKSEVVDQHKSQPQNAQSVDSKIILQSNNQQQREKDQVENETKVEENNEMNVEIGQKILLQNIHPSQITIGFVTTGPFLFNDLNILEQKQAIIKEKEQILHKIRSIQIQWKNEHIIGIRFSYITESGNIIKGHNNLKFRPFRTFFGITSQETIKIEKEDDILEIYGRAKNHINKIGIKTYLGLNYECGNDLGDVFSFKFPGFTFGAASGGYNDNIDFLVIEVREISETNKALIKLQF